MELQTILATTFGIITVVVTSIIAISQRFRLHNQGQQLHNQGQQLHNQEQQLRQLQHIGRETAEIARKLQADTYAQEIIKRFFFIEEETHHVYKCVLPVQYRQRPLPLIVAGDYHDLHVLQTLMGAEKLELVPVTQDAPHSGVAVLDSDTIFLCAPPNNQALDDLAPPLSHEDGNGTGTPMFGDIDLPCWFAVHWDSSARRQVRGIWIPEIENILHSPSEKHYENAEKLRDGEPYDSKSTVQIDYCILVRLKYHERRVIVIAGIHQYGTWIGGHFFEMLARGEELSWRHVFESADDFVAIIWGEFNSDEYQVYGCDILQNYLWVRKDGHWERVERNPSGIQELRAVL